MPDLGVGVPAPSAERCVRHWGADWGTLRRAGAVLAQRQRWLYLAFALAVCAEFLLMSQDPYVMSSHYDELLCKALFMAFYVSILGFIVSFDSFTKH
jgi:hypothetical protein